MKGQGNQSFQSAKGPKGLTDTFYSWEKVYKTYWYSIFSYFKDGTFTQELKGVQCFSLGM